MFFLSFTNKLQKKEQSRQWSISFKLSSDSEVERITKRVATFGTLSLVIFLGLSLTFLHNKYKY